MTSASRLHGIRLIAFSLILILSSLAAAQQRDPIIEKIAKAYGLDSYDKIEAIRYTWGIDIPGLFKATHKWEWEPKTGKISFETTDKEGKPVKVSYDSSQLNSQSDQVKNEVEPAFVNDNYWLLFPLHAYWDKSATITNQGMQKLPIGPGSATLVSVKYPADAGGYTPGDTWDFDATMDIELADILHPPLTTLRLSRSELASLFFKALEALRSEPHIGGKQYSITTTLVVRGSTAAVRSD